MLPMKSLALRLFAASGMAAALVAVLLIARPGLLSGAKAASGQARSAAVVQFVPTPTQVGLLSVDSAGNMMLRGVTAVVPGKPTKDSGKLDPSCAKSAEANGEGTLTVCFTPDAGRVIRDTLSPGIWPQR